VHLELDDLLLVDGTLNLLGNLGGLSVLASLEEALSVVELVLLDLREELGKLVIMLGSCSVVLNVEAAVGEQGESRTVTRAELDLVGQDADNLQTRVGQTESTVLTSWYLPSPMRV
jgi:hypothetical protein